MKKKSKNKQDVNLLKFNQESLEQAYLAGYKKGAEMSNLEYDFASELHAKSNFIKWKNKQL